jgi:hypothetical protein
VSRLSDDEHIKPWLPHMVTVFERLPLETQTKMVVSALKISCDSDHDGEGSDARARGHGNRLRLVRTLLSDFGLVGIKGGQDLAGHPEIPPEYRQVFADLRDNNEPMGYAEFWQRIPAPFRRRLKKLGRGLGVGSVKQVHLALLELDDSRQVEVAGGLIGKHVEDDLVAGLQALATLPEVAGLGDKIRAMTEPELNIRADARSFAITRQTALGNGTVPCLYVPEVWDSTMTCVIREAAAGPTVAHLMAFPDALAHDEDKQVLFHGLSTLHTTAIHTGLKTTPSVKGLISSDLHPGNIVFQRVQKRLVLIDTGQHDWISHRESTAFLWTLAALSDQANWRKYAPIALTQLAQVAEIKTNAFGQLTTQSMSTSIVRKDNDKSSTTSDDDDVQQRLWRALCKSQQEPNIQMRFTQLLRAADAEGLVLPRQVVSVAVCVFVFVCCFCVCVADIAEENIRRYCCFVCSGFVSAGKMLDVFRAQEALLGLPPIVDQEIKQLVRQRVTWQQTPYVLWRKLLF